MTATQAFNLSLEISPPASVQPGVPFTLPVIVSFRPIGRPPQDRAGLVAYASLRNESGTSPVEGLSGDRTRTLSSSSGGTMSGYVKFDSLAISKPGKYRLRVLFGENSPTREVTVKQTVDSGVINVHAAAPAAQRPSGSSLSLCSLVLVSSILSFVLCHSPPPVPFSTPCAILLCLCAPGSKLTIANFIAPTQLVTLQRLTAENLVSAADIAAWQRA